MPKTKLTYYDRIRVVTTLTISWALILLLKSPSFSYEPTNQIKYRTTAAQYFQSVAVDESGNQMAVSIHPLNVIIVYDVPTGKAVAELDDIKETPSHLFYDDIQSELIAVYRSKLVVWRKSDYRLVLTFDILPPVTAAYNPEKRHLVTAQLNKILVYELNSGTLQVEKEISGSYLLTQLTFTPDGRYLYVLHGLDTIEQIETSDYSVVKKISVNNLINFACSEKYIAVLSHQQETLPSGSQVLVSFFDHSEKGERTDIVPKKAFPTFDATMQMIDANTTLLKSSDRLVYIDKWGNEDSININQIFNNFMSRSKVGVFLIKKDEIHVLNFQGQTLNRFHINGYEGALFYSDEGSERTALWDQGMLAVARKGLESSIKKLPLGYRIKNGYAVDGSYVAFATSNKEIDVWDLETGQKVSSVSDMERYPAGIALAKDINRLFAFFTDSPVIRVWDLKTGKLDASLENKGGAVTSIDADKDWLVAGDVNGNYTVWQIPDYSIRFPGEDLLRDSVSTIKIFKKKNRLAAGSFGRVILVDLKTMQASVFRGHNSSIRGVDFTDDGRFLVSTADDGMIKMWDLDQGRLIESYTVERGWVDRIHFLDKLNFIASGPAVASAVFNNEKLYEEIMDPKPDLIVQTANTSEVTQIIFSHQGDLMANIEGNRGVRIWDVNTGFMIARIYPDSGAANDILFSEDDSTIIITTGDALEYWDPYTGKKLKQVDLKIINLSVHQIERHPNTGLMLAMNMHGWHDPIWLHINSAKGFGWFNQNQDSSNRDSQIIDLTVSNDGRRIATYGNRFIKVFNESGAFNFVNELTIPREDPEKWNRYWRDCLHFSSDGRFLSYAILKDRPAVVVYDLKEKRKVVDREGKFSAFGPENVIIYMDSNESLALLNVETDTVVSKLRGGKHASLISALSYNSKKSIFASGDIWGNINLWDAETGRHIRESNRFENDIYNSELSPNGRFLAYNSRQGLFLYDVRQMRTIPVDGNKYPYFGAFSPDSRRFYYRKSRTYYALNLDDFKIQELFKTRVSSKNAGSTRISADGKYLLFGHEKNEDYRIYNLKTLQQTAQIKKTQVPGALRFSLIEFNPENSAELLGISLNRSAVKTISFQLVQYNFFTGTLKNLGDKRIFDFKDEKDFAQYRLGHETKVNILSPSGKYYAFTQEFDLKVINLAAGRELYDRSMSSLERAVFTPDEKHLILADRNGFISKLSLDSFRIEKQFRALKAKIGELEIKGRFLRVLGDNEIIKIYDLEADDRQVLSISFMGQGDFIIMNDQGHYYASKKARIGVAFKKGGRIFPFEQFDLIYNRPDKALKELAQLGLIAPELIQAYKNAYIKRLRRMQFKEANLRYDFQVPEIEILTKDLPVSTEDDRISFKIKAADQKYMLNRINIWVNDVPVYGLNGIDLSEKNTQTDQIHIELPLSYGKNKIQVSVLNQAGVESNKETFEINCGKPVKPVVLHIVAVGVSEYQQSAMNLRYAYKDAQDVVDLFSGKKGQTIAMLVGNKEAVRKNILALKRRLSKSGVDDQVIIHYAGHGLLDKDNNYYLSTYDMDFNHPELKGIAYEELEYLLDGIPARNKLVLVDSCHSGELDKGEMDPFQHVGLAAGVVSRSFADARGQVLMAREEALGLNNSFRLMQELFSDLRRGTGASVISAAGGAEYAYERESLKNGVFTHSIIRGLKDRQADLDGNGEIIVSELQEYLRDRVSKMTGGRQQPTFRLQNLSNDWIVWK